MKKMLFGLLCAAMTLVGCSSSNEPAEDELSAVIKITLSDMNTTANKAIQSLDVYVDGQVVAQLTAKEPVFDKKYTIKADQTIALKTRLNYATTFVKEKDDNLITCACTYNLRVETATSTNASVYNKASKSLSVDEKGFNTQALSAVIERDYTIKATAITENTK